MIQVKKKALYQVVKETIFNYIKDNKFEGGKLPTEEKFSEILGVSRLTVRSALNELASEGFIFRKHGKGTFLNVEAFKTKAPLSPLKPFFNIIEDLGYKCTIKNFGFKICEMDKYLKNLLNVSSEQEKIVFTSKVFYGDDIPFVYCEDFFSTEVLKNIDVCDKISDFPESIFNFSNTVCNKKITWDKVEILTTTNKKYPHLNSVFQLKDNEYKEFLVIKGVNYDSENTPILYAVEYIDTSKVSFTMIRQKITF